MTEKAIFFDSLRCTACHGCQVACKLWNGLPSSLEKNANEWSGSLQNPVDINGDTRLIITFNEQEGGSKGIEWAFGRRSCQHCTEAPCATVCPGGALTRDEETGFVTVDEDKCIGCQYCHSACPFDVPRYYGDNSKINKCTGCLDRVEHGMVPACVHTCQPGALQFGDRDKMIELAHERLEYAKSKGFDKAVVYGETEMGGLHVIQLLKYGVDAHGQVANPEVPANVPLTQIMKPITGAVSGLAVLGFAAMFGLASGYKRPTQAYNPETGDTLDVETGEVLKHGDGQAEASVKEIMFENLPIGKKKGEDNE